MENAKIKEELLPIIKEKAIIKGKVMLTSGKEADFYIDGKQVTLDPQGLFLVGKFAQNHIHAAKADAVGGPTMGADPIAAAVALLSSQSGNPLKAFIVRKEAKKHGMQKMIEGPKLEKGDKVIIVEDVVTTGRSVKGAINEVEKLGAQVVKVICLVDREAGADKLLQPYNYTPIFSLTELGL